VAGRRRSRITSGTITTAGATYDGKYSLAINEVNGEPCLCVHKCDLRGCMHYSTLDNDSLVTALDRRTLEAALRLLDGPVWRRAERKEADNG
jgi:hypothetical protein